MRSPLDLRDFLQFEVQLLHVIEIRQRHQQLVEHGLFALQEVKALTNVLLH